MLIWLVKRLVTRLTQASAQEAQELGKLYEEARSDSSVFRRLVAIVQMRMLQHRSEIDLKKAQNYASILINRVLMTQISKVGSESVLADVWSILFNWDVPIALKNNLEDSLIHLLQQWGPKLEKLFVRAIRIIISWLIQMTKYSGPIHGYSVDLGKNEVNCSLTISLTPKSKIASLQDVIIFLSTCIATSIRSTKLPKTLQNLLQTLQSYIQYVRQRYRPMQDLSCVHHNYTQLLKLINYILDSCQSFDDCQTVVCELITKYLIPLDFSPPFFSKIYSIAAPFGSNHNYCCIRFIKREYDHTILTLKLEAAKLHLALERNSPICAITAKTINTILLSANCVVGPLHRYRSNELTLELTARLMEVYLHYCQQVIERFSQQNQDVVAVLVDGILKIGDTEESLYEDSFEGFYHLVENCMERNEQLHPKVVAAKILHYFAQKETDILNYLTNICQIGLKFKSSPTQQQGPSPATCIFILGIILDLLPADSPLPHQLLQLLNCPNLQSLPSLTLSLLLFLTKRNFPRLFPQPTQCESLIISCIKIQNSGLVRLLAFELAEASCSFNWQIFQAVHDQLDRQCDVEFVERMLSEAKWTYLCKFVQRHVRQFDRERLYMMLKEMRGKIREKLTRMRLGWLLEETALMKSVEVVDLIVSDRYFVLMADEGLKRTLRDFYLYLLRQEAGYFQTEIKASLLAIIGKLLVVEDSIPAYLLEILPGLTEEFSKHPVPSLLILFSQYLTAYEFLPNQPYQIVEIFNQVMRHLEAQSSREYLDDKHLTFIEDMLVVVQLYIYAVRYGVDQGQLSKVVAICHRFLERKVLRARVASTYALASMYIYDSLTLQDIVEECQFGTFQGVEAELFVHCLGRMMEEVHKHAFEKFRMLLLAVYSVVRHQNVEASAFHVRKPENIAKFSFPWEVTGQIHEKGCLFFSKLRGNAELYDVMMELRMIPVEIERYFSNSDQSQQSWSRIQTKEELAQQQSPFKHHTRETETSCP